MYQNLFLLATAIFLSLSSSAAVELDQIDFTVDKGTVIINWTTLSETDCEFFVIERSVRTNNWIEIHKPLALGDMQTGMSYEFTDNDLPRTNLTYFYKLSEMDFNGVKTELEEIQVFVPNYIDNVSNQDVTFTEEPSEKITQRSASEDPICEVASFTALEKGGEVMVSWVTTHEENCTFFMVQRRTDDSDWTLMTSIEAKGDINTSAVYNWMDTDFERLNTFYRLIVVGDTQVELVLSECNINLGGASDEDRPDEPSYHSPSDLSVNLINFNAKETHNLVRISFTTLQEQNCKSFFVEKSIDRTNWKTVARAIAVGLNDEQSYRMKDGNRINQKTYYRLMAQDHNGNNTILAETVILPSNINEIQVYPNPANETLFIQSDVEIENVQFSLTDMEGNVMISGSKIPAHKLTLDLSTLEEGLYILTITDGNNTRTEKVLVK